ncbi:hypothetical protein G3H63_09420 [Microbacterium resistens]|uniref:hypothetical protein n=1 Tax=Microbacterium resistens TaxID=156977 RepID=UPI001C57C5AE|nr:hypothetical protein [Microbacterium resistens]MBW1639289.1 hypothetical protein [Microbacterium resistens]
MIEHIEERMMTWYSMLGFGPFADDYFPPEDRTRTIGGLLEVSLDHRDRFVILTPTHTGYVRVHIRVFDREPPEADMTEWEDMAITTIDSPSGDLVPQSSDAIRIPPNLLPGPGTYGVRVLGRGRDLPQPDDLDITAPDRYLVDIWPAPPEGVAERTIIASEKSKEFDTYM